MHNEHQTSCLSCLHSTSAAQHQPGIGEISCSWTTEWHEKQGAWLGFYFLGGCSRQNWVLAKCGSDSKASACNAGDPGSIPGSGRSLEREMATHSCILAWRIPWTEKPGRLQSTGLQRVGHDWATSLSLYFFLLYLEMKQSFPCWNTPEGPLW